MLVTVTMKLPVFTTGQTCNENVATELAMILSSALQ